MSYASKPKGIRMSAAAWLNDQISSIRTARHLTRKEFAILTGIPADTLEAIEGHRCEVSRLQLERLAATLPEGKKLVAQWFGLDFQTPSEMHELVARMQALLGGVA